MLDYDRLYISKGTDPAKSNSNKECMTCYYWFFNHGFKFQDYVCNVCHDLTMLGLNKSDITIITAKCVCIVYNISKSEAINLFKKSVLENRVYIKKNMSKFSVYSKHFSYVLCFAIDKMVDSMDIYESLNVNMGTVMRNPEMLKFVPDNLQTKENVQAYS